MSLPCPRGAPLLAALLAGATGCGDDSGTTRADAGAADAAGGAADARAVDARPGVALANINVQLEEMSPHLHDLNVFSVISGDGALVARYVLTELPAASFLIQLPGVELPPSNYRLDFFSDLDRNGVYSGVDADHAWRLGLTGESVEFIHNFGFTDIGAPAITTPGEDFALAVTNVDDLDDHQLDVRVFDAASGALVARLVRPAPSVETRDRALVVLDMIAPGTEYRVDLHLDVDDDLGYDAPPDDLAWRYTATATAAGLELTLDGDDETIDVEF